MARLAGRASEPCLKLFFIKLALLFSLVTTVTSGSILGTASPKCVSFCKESSKFGFQPGMTYRYNYKAELRTFATGSPSEESRIHLTTSAEVTAITACELQLELKDVQLTESDPKNHATQSPLPNSAELTRELTQRPLRFSFQNGKMEHICAMEQDGVWVLNIKRGILSTFQNTMDDVNKAQSLQESDVSGKCFTHYELQPTSQSHLIRKTKDLKGCSQRHSHVSAVQSVAYASNSPVQNIPLLTGSQDCQQIIRNHQIEKVECREEHKFQPFNDAESGVTTVVTVSLSLEASRTAPIIQPEALEYKKLSLVFETQAIEEASEADIRDLLVLLETLERESVPKVTIFAPDRFLEFVAQLRMINYPALTSLFNKAPSPVSRTLLLDALPLVATAPSLTFMRELFSEGKLSELQIDSWLTSITFINHPRLEMISAIAPLLDREPKNQALLAISAVINAYCKDHESCAQETPIQETLQTILTFLGNCKAATYGDEERMRVIYALKAIGNAGRLPLENNDKAIQLVQTCFQESTNPIEVRLGGVDAFRRLPCDHYNHKPLVDRYADTKENSEVRIMAYLMAMKCPHRELIDIVKDTLYTDTVNQVGSFVWTHLTNIQETSNPAKQAVKELLSNDFLSNKFNTDARKYSRNYESSMFWEDKNIGGGVDANVIFTPDSFLPRSTSLNLTMFLFGESINLFEIGGRIHSFEEMLESIFGPEGYFPEPHVNEALNAVRSKRDVTNNGIERLGSVFNQAGMNRDRLPGGSIFMRIFGNEISYKNLEFAYKQRAPTLIDENGKNWLDLTFLLDNLGTGKSTEFTKSSILMDTSYTVPTTVGIPLTLSVQGAASVGLKASGKIDLINYWENEELDIQGALQPSGTIQIDGQLSLQLGKLNSKLRSGLKFQNTLHSATGLETRFLVKGSSVLHASLTIPQPKQEILEVKSQLMLLSPSGKYSRVIGEDSFDQPLEFCSPDFISTLTGLKLCGRAQIPSEYSFPLLKPAAMSLSIEKTDTFQTYEFDYKWTADEDGRKQDVSLLFNTPGSTIDRRMAVSYSLDKVNGRMEGKIETPLKSLSVQGLYSKAAKNLQVTLNSNAVQIFMLSAGLRQQMIRLEPHLLLSYYGRPVVDAQGVIHLANILESDGKANFDMTVKHLTTSPIQLKGEVIRNKEMLDGRVGMESSLMTGNVRSQIRLRPAFFSSKSEIQYSWRRSEMRFMSLSSKFQKVEKGGVAKYTAGLTTNSAHFPHFNTDFSWETSMARGYQENNLKLLVGKTRWEGRTLFKNQFRRQQQDVQILFAFSAPQNNLDYHLEFQHQKNQSGLFTKFTGRIDSTNELIAHTEYLRNNEKLLKRKVKAEITWPGSRYALRSGITEIRTGEFEAELIISSNGRADKKGSIKYKNASNKKRQDHSFELRAQEFLPVPLMYGVTLVASDRQSLITTQLQIEGQERYSGRWGGSFDYNASKRFAHKIEAKAFANDQNYSGELNWRQTKLGDQTFTADIQLSQHFYVELQIKKGDPSDIFWGTLTVIPDKDFHPQEKVVVEGKLSSESGKIQIDYFGEQMSLAGEYSRRKVQMEAEWESKRLAFTVETPIVKVERFVLTARIETPIEGYKTLGLNIDHTYKGNTINSRVQAHHEGKSYAFALYGHLDTAESTFSVMWDATGMNKHTLVVKMSESGPTKRFELTTTIGIESSVLKLETMNIHRSCNVKVDFSGNSLLPEMELVYNRQKTSQVTDDLILRWTPQGSPTQQIEVRISHLMNPLKLSFLFTTPWKNYEKVEGQFSLFQSQLNQEIKIYLNGPLSTFPFNLEMKLGGSQREFQHSFSSSWFDIASKTPKSIQISTNGKFLSLNDGELKIDAKIPNHNYKLEMSSSKNIETGLKVETQFVYDDQMAQLGFDWLNEDLHKIQTSFGLILPNQPKINLSFAHLRTREGYVLEFTCGTDAKLRIDLKHEGWLKWDMTTDFTSPFNFLPTVHLSSKQDMTKWDDLNHRTEYKINGISEMWGGQKTRNGSLTLTVKNGKFESEFFADTKYLHLTGEIDTDSPKKSLKVWGDTPIFPNYKFYTGVDFERSLRGSAYFNVSINETQIYSWNVVYRMEGESIDGEMYLDSLFGHEVQASMKLNPAKSSLEFDLKELTHELISINLKTSVQNKEGQIQLNLDGNAHPFLQKKNLNASYSLSSEKFELQGQYEDVRGKSSVLGSGVFTPALKKLELSMTGQRQFAYTLEINENRELMGRVMSMGKTLYEIGGNYEVETGDFAFGKHTLKVTVSNGNTYSFQTTVGLDMTKVHVHIATPFDSWKNILLKGGLQLGGTINSAILSYRKEALLFNLKVDSIFSSERGNVEVEIITPWEGYQTVSYLVEYDVKGDAMSGKVDISLETSKVLLQGRLSSREAQIELQTPYEVMQNLLLSAQWTLEKESNSLHLAGKLNDLSRALRVTWNFQPTNGLVYLTLSGEQGVTLNLSYNLRSAYSAEASLQLSGKKHLIGGKFEFTPQDFQIEIHTPFKTLTNVGAKGSHIQPSPGTHQLSFHWNLNGQGDQITAESVFSDQGATFELQTPLTKPWNSINGQLIYEMSATQNRVSIQARRGDNKEFSMTTSLNTQGQMFETKGVASTSLKFHCQSPLNGWEEVEFDVNYKRIRTTYLGDIRLMKGTEILKSDFTMTLAQTPRRQMTFQATIALPPLKIQTQVNTSMKLDLRGESSIKAELTHNGVDYAIDTSIQCNSSSFKLQAHSSFSAIRKLVVSGTYDRLSNIGLSFQVNEKTIQMKLQGAYDGFRNFKFNTDIVTPFEGFRAIHGETQLSLIDRNSHGSFSFQNERLRYMGKFDAVIDSDSGDLRLQFNSPLYRFENIIGNLKYENSRAMFQLERNTKKEVIVEVSLQEGQLVFGFISNFPSFPMKSRSLVDWNRDPMSLQLNLEGGPGEHLLNVKCNIEGFRDGALEIRTPYKQYENISLLWMFEGSLANGLAKYSYDLPAYGKKGLRASWKQNHFKTLEAEVWWNENGANDKGISGQYAWAPLKSGVVLGGSLSYIRDTQPEALTFSMSIKQREEGKVSLIDFSLKTPFTPIEDLSFNGELTLNQDISLDFSATLNKVKSLTLFTSLAASPLISNLTLIVNAPAISDPFKLNAVYNLTTSDKYIELSFAQNKYKLNVKAQAIVPENNPQEIELRMNVDSNIPTVTVSARASLRAAYKIENDGTRQVTISVDSEQAGNWRATASMRPRANFSTKFRLDSPHPAVIPSIKTDLSWSKISRQGLVGVFTHQMGSHEIRTKVTVGDDQFKVTFNSAFPGLEDVLIEGRLDSGFGNVNKKLNIEIRVAGKIITLNTNIVVPSKSQSLESSIRLLSTWEMIPNASLEASLDEDGLLSIHGNWGARSVDMKGDFKGKKDLTLWEAAEADVSLSMDDVDMLKFKSHHVFKDNEYSWNMTFGGDYSFNSFFQQIGDRLRFSGGFKWTAEDAIRLSAEANRGTFNSSLQTPWSREMEVSGSYKISDDEYSANGFIIYDGLRSGLQAKLLTKDEAVAASVSVDVPVLSQKFDAEIYLQMSNPENVNGQLEMSMGDRRVSIKGSFLTTYYQSTQFGQMAQHILKVSLNLPRSELGEIGSDWTLRRPTSGWHHAQIEGALLFSPGNHKFAFRYEIPTFGSKRVSVDWFIDCSFLTHDVLKGSFEMENLNLDKFSGGFKYRENELSFTWSLDKNYIFDMSIHSPNIFHEASPLRLQVEGIWDVPSEFRLRSTFSANQESSSVDVFFVKNNDELILRFFSDSPPLHLEKVELQFKIHENAKRVIDISGSRGSKFFSAIGEFVSSDTTLSLSLKVSGSYGAHFVQVAGAHKDGGYHMEFNGESLNLFKGKKINVAGNVSPTPSGFTATIECRTKQSVHGATLTVDFRSDGGIVMLKVECPNVEPLLLDAQYGLNSNKLSLKLIANIIQLHHFEFFVDWKEMEGKLYVLCPYIYTQPLKSHLKGKIEKNDVSFIGDINLAKYQFRGEGTFRFEDARNLEGKFEIITPFKTFDRLTLGGKLGDDVAEFEFRTPIKDLPNFMFKAAGIPFYDSTDFANFHPKLVLGLPWVTYTFGGSLQVPLKTREGKFGAMFELEFPNEKAKLYDAYIHLTPLEHLEIDMEKPMQMKLEGNSPIEGFRHFECVIAGNIVWKRWADFTAEVGINNQKMSFISQLRSETENRKLSIVLSTPFKDYERFGILFQIQNFEEIGAGQNVQLEFRYPGLINSLTIEVDYRLRYNGLLEMEGEFKVAAPTTEMPPLLMQMSSEWKDSKYSGILEGAWGEHRPIFKVDTAITPDTFSTTIEGKMGERNEYQFMSKVELVLQSTRWLVLNEMALNYEQYFLFSTGIVKDKNLMEGEVKLKTPFQILRSASAICRLSPFITGHLSLEKILTTLDMSLGASYNDQKLIHLELVNKKGKRSFEIHNPLRPVSLSIGYDVTPKKQMFVKAELCWDLRNEAESTLGFHFNLDNQLKEGKAGSLKIHGGKNGNIELRLSHLFTAQNFEQAVNFKWNQPHGDGEGETGYQIFWRDDSKSSLKKYDLKVHVDVPWRSVELKTTSSYNDKECSQSALLLWDAKENPNKHIGGKLFSLKSQAWRNHSLKQILTLIHSGFPHDLTFTLERNYKNQLLQMIAFVFQPNSFPQDTLTAHFSRDVIQNKEIRLLMTHPATNIDIMMHLKQTDATTSLSLAHMDIQGEKMGINLEATSDVHGTLLDIQTPAGPLLQLEYKPSSDQPNFSLKLLSMEMTGEYTSALPLLKGSMKYDEGRELMFVAGLPHTKEITLKISRNEFGMNIRDFLLTFRLNTSQILSTYIHWRPETAEDFRQLFTSDIPSSINKFLYTEIPKILSLVNDEIEERLAVLDPSLQKFFVNLKSYSYDEIELMVTEYNRLVDYFVSIHHKNSLYTQNVQRFLSSIWNQIYVMCSGSIESVQNFAIDVGTTLLHGVTEMKEFLTKNVGNLEKTLMPLWEASEKNLIRLWNDYSGRTVKFIKKTLETYETIGQILNGNVKELEKKFKGLDIVQKTKKLYTDYSIWIQELSMQEYVDEGRQLFIETIWNPIEILYKPYFVALTAVVENGNLVALLETPPFTYLRFVFSRILSLGNRFWVFVEMEQKIKGLVRNILSRIDAIVQRHLPTTSMVWNIDKGYIEYHQPLSILEWDGFKEAPRFKETDEDSAQAQQVHDFYFDLLDTIRNTRPLLEFDLRDILPPFGATAVMAGDQHYLTFDKTYFRFSGECNSYVLVGDLLHQNFTLLVNYEKEGAEPKKKSYSLMTGVSRVDIDSDSLAVSLDGQSVELPMSVGPTFIRRQPSGLEIMDRRGFEMKCSQSPSVCTISVSGWYFGKLGGLLGSYDNEHLNDMKTPDGNMVLDLENFAHSWRVGPKNDECQMKNYAETTEVTSDEEVCKQLMNTPTSPFRPCYTTVDVTPYNEMCKYDLANGKVSSKEGRACTAVAAYVMQCQQQGIDIWMPPQCVQCKLEDGSSIVSGENVTYSSEHLRAPNSADVVFLIEEATSLRGYNLVDIMSKLDSAFKNEGIENNRYAVIGFGGKGPRERAHIQTINSQVWSPMASLKSLGQNVMNGEGKGNLYDAIDYAATIGYRAGVSKTIVAIATSTDQCEDATRYSDSLTLLLENDIRFHLLVPEDISMKIEKKQDEASKVFGIDMDSAFTVRHIKPGPIEGDKSLRRHLKIPKDLCTPLAMETTGTLFNLKTLRLPALSKKFVDVWARRLASTSKPSPCQRCECLPDREGGATTLCHHCVSPNLQKFIDDLNKFEQHFEFEIPADSIIQQHH